MRFIPKMFEFRKWISFKLVELAQSIYPESEYVKAFRAQLVEDQMIMGRHIVRVSPYEELMKDFE